MWICVVFHPVKGKKIKMHSKQPANILISGDLKTYLLSRRNLVGQNSKEAEDVTARRLTQMALDIANGMKYLHDYRYVHR